MSPTRGRIPQRRLSLVVFSLVFPLVLSTLLVGCPERTSELPPDAETVVLLHGLGRTSWSMEPLEERLTAAGYRVVNLDYPSREKTPEDLAAELRTELATCCGEDRKPVHFVTHSLGGILVRLLAKDPETLPIEIGRVVMLSPPNQGSEVVDTLGDTTLFETVMGPTGQALGTEEESLPNRLGPVTFELGVITGNASIEPHLSVMIPGEDDGKVAVERAKVEGMKDFLVVPATHPFIMADEAVGAQVERFLREGRFLHEEGSGQEQQPEEKPDDE